MERVTRLLLAPVTVAVVLGGLVVAAGLVSNDFTVARAATGTWFAVVVIASLLIWRRAPQLRLPVAAVALVTIVLAGGLTALTTLRDETVDEAISAGTTELEGSFEARSHTTTGTARVIAGEDGSRILALVDFETDAGPDLFVYVFPERNEATDIDGATRIASLKGNVGNQQYTLPDDLELGDTPTVLIWCRIFSVPFGAANLSAQT
jgi:Electron transfer DM13